MRAGSRSRGRSEHAFGRLAATYSESFRGNWRRFHFLCLFLVLIFLTGGASRPDVASLALLRPAAVLMFALGLVTLRREQVRAHWFLFAFGAAVAAVILAYLVPLPYGIWSKLAGRDVVVELDRLAGAGQIWRPASMAPDFTWNAFWSLFVPAAILVHGVQLSAEDVRRLALLWIAGCVVSCVLALVQLAGARDGAAYLYDITNNGAAVGLFANRNHQAVFLAVTLLVLAGVSAPRGKSTSEDRRGLVACIIGTLLISPLILTTGSRAGLVFGLLCLLLMPLIYRKGQKAHRRTEQSRATILLVIAAIMVVGLAVSAAVFSGQAISLDRAIATVPLEDGRYDQWLVAIKHFPDFFPLGPGPGAYQDAFFLKESESVLTETYSNHAHNDWLEVFVTLGYLGSLFLAVAASAYIWALSKTRRRHQGSASRVWNITGLLVIAVFGLASVVDYPMRTPIVSSLFVIACLWAGLGRGGATPHDRAPSSV